MAQVSSFKFPEKNHFSENTEVKDSQYESTELRETLPIDVWFVLVPQANATALYNIRGVEVSGARFWLVRLLNDGNPLEARTISKGSLMRMYIKTIDSLDETLPTFPTKTTANGLRADCDYIRAMPDTSFIKERVIDGVKRLIIDRPVKFKVIRRGDVAIIAYEEELNASGHHDCKVDIFGRAVCQIKHNVHTFSTPEEVSKDLADKAMKALKSLGDSHFYPL